jgi:hypothetical protein
MFNEYEFTYVDERQINDDVWGFDFLYEEKHTKSYKCYDIDYEEQNEYEE